MPQAFLWPPFGWLKKCLALNNPKKIWFVLFWITFLSQFKAAYVNVTIWLKSWQRMEFSWREVWVHLHWQQWQLKLAAKLWALADGPHTQWSYGLQRKLTRVDRHCNRLLGDVVKLPSLEVFKRRVDVERYGLFLDLVMWWLDLMILLVISNQNDWLYV